MHFTSRRILDDRVTERTFTLGDVSGILWTPPAATPTAPVPLILMGQPGGIGMRRMYPRLVARARNASAQGFAAATIELPGAGERAPLPGAELARADLVRAITAGEKPSADVVDRLILPLVDRAVPEWQATLDESLELPEIGDRVAFSGGVIAIGTRLAAIDARIVAAGLFAGSYVPRSTMAEARRVTIRCTCCSSGTTRATTARWHSTCSMHSARRRRRCTPTWAATPECRRLPGRTPPGSSPVTSGVREGRRPSDLTGARRRGARRGGGIRRTPRLHPMPASAAPTISRYDRSTIRMRLMEPECNALPRLTAQSGQKSLPRTPRPWRRIRPDGSRSCQGPIRRGRIILKSSNAALDPTGGRRTRR